MKLIIFCNSKSVDTALVVRDSMVGGFTTTYEISIPITTLNLWTRIPLMAGVQRYVIKFGSDLHNSSSVVFSHGVLRFPPPKKLTATKKLKYC